MSGRSKNAGGNAYSTLAGGNAYSTLAGENAYSTLAGESAYSTLQWKDLPALWSLARRLIAICAIAAMLALSAASSSASHIHAKSPAGQCDICVTVHVVSSEAVPIVHLFQAPDTQERLIAGEVTAGYRLPTLRSAPDRGPPSL